MPFRCEISALQGRRRKLGSKATSHREGAPGSYWSSQRKADKLVTCFSDYQTLKQLNSSDLLLMTSSLLNDQKMHEEAFNKHTKSMLENPVMNGNEF